MPNDTISSNKFICSLCNKSFTTKNGLKKHSTKKIPCVVDNTKKYKCEKCNIFLSSKRNLDNHLLTDKMNELRDRLFIAENDKKENLTEDNLIEDNLIEDNLINETILPHYISITIEEYNYFYSLKNEIYEVKNKYETLFGEFKKMTEEFKRINDENQKLRDENKKLNITNNIDNSINNSVTNNITNNIDNSITNNIQIHIVSINNETIDIKYILESFKDENSPLYDFLKIFNYEYLNYPKIYNNLNDYQRCKAIKIRRNIERERKKVIPSINSGFCKILGKHYLVISHRNIKYLGKNICQVYNNQKWELITIYDAKQLLFKKIINSMTDYLKLHLNINIIDAIKIAIKFITNDFYKNSKEYICCNDGEFIMTIKKLI
jgi:hypothetical protein